HTHTHSFRSHTQTITHTHTLFQITHTHNITHTLFQISHTHNNTHTHTQRSVKQNALNQGSSTFFSPRTPWLKETLGRDPHPRRPKFGPDIHIFYLELSVSHTHTHT